MTNATDKKMADRVLRRYCGASIGAQVRLARGANCPPTRKWRAAHSNPNVVAKFNLPAELPIVVVGANWIDAALWGAALGRAYGAAIKAYDKGKRPAFAPLGSDERAVARDLAEYTTPVSWGGDD